MSRFRVVVCLAVLSAVGMSVPSMAAAPKKPHVVGLGAARTVPYSKAGDPAGAAADETALETRPLLVDGRVSEWTTGDAHDVTDRSFVVRRALRVNDSLPAGSNPDAKSNHTKAENEKTAHAEPVHWVWQRGPWLLVDRITGHVTALKLPDYDPGVSQVVWFRDYAAYCGVTASGKSLYAVVAQLGVRKPVLAKKLEGYDAGDHATPVCGSVEWQREPLRVTFHPAGRDAAGFDLVGGSAALVEGEDDETGTSQ
ncbi:hypothetical protein ACFPT7_00935 [Acidicapsa dinghuensis]|uniref:Secreted protein n=1 Tax=Acidicapsa dinghuensis TaxID=2218256 RepID=A0ABW1EAA0_9BACT|nr:hypothetical protein [Acidicapsa dinghuensis]